MNVANETKSVAQKVRETIQMRPSLLDALKLDIVNYSAMARLLQDEIEEGSLEAIKAAIIRISEEISDKHGLQEEKVLSILRNTKVTLQDKIAVLISPKELKIPYIVTAYLTDSYIYVADQTRLEEKSVEQAQITSNLVALVLISPKIVETTPGFVSFITHLLASWNINIVEFLSCSTKTVIILDTADALQAFSLLQNYT